MSSKIYTTRILCFFQKIQSSESISFQGVFRCPSAVMEWRSETFGLTSTHVYHKYIIIIIIVIIIIFLYGDVES
jgi:hypothetical protein